MIPSATRIFVCAEPQDMRRSFDGLSLAAERHLDEDPKSGALFVFVNKRRDRATLCISKIDARQSKALIVAVLPQIHRASLHDFPHSSLDAFAA